MPTLHVSPLSRLAETVAATGASRLVTLINLNSVVERPATIAAERHLFLGFSDIVEPLDGHVLPGEEHVRSFLGFLREWERTEPIVLHCWAGISRSTAGAFIAACALAPEGDEARIARRLRRASPSATPNARLVALADAELGRDGRMMAAAAGIGRGADAFEGEPFAMPLS